MKKKIILGLFIVLSLFCGCGLKEKANKYDTAISNGKQSDTNKTENPLFEGSEEDKLGKTYIENTSEESGGQEEETSMVENENLDIVEHNGFIFSTEYTIKDYCRGCFIVSKNNDLLYGMLDIEGNEILPVKYDNIYFLNKEEVMEGIGDVYIKTIYEGSQTIVTIYGNAILENDGVSELSYIEYEIPGKTYDSLFFLEESDRHDWIKLYDMCGRLQSVLNCGENKRLDIQFLTKDYFLLTRIGGNATESIYKDITLYNTEIQVIKQWEGMGYRGMNDELTSEGNYVFMLFGDGVYQYILDEDGNLQEDGTVSVSELQSKYIDDTIKNTGSDNVYYLGIDKDIRLFESNNTWKLVDCYDEPLYDERYYACYEVDGCYFLLNEDNEICLIDSSGRKILDYGWVTWDGSTGWFNGAMIDSDNFFVGDDGVCFVVGDDVYFFE